MKQFSKKMRPLLILSIVSTSPMGDGLLFSPSLAMNPPAPANNVMFNYNDFIADQGTRLGQEKRIPNSNQKKAIEDFFKKSSGKSRDILFNEIDVLLKPDNKIVGQQAAALKRYIDNIGVQAPAPQWSPQGNQAAAPQGQTKVDLLAWTKIVADIINKYFSQPYQTSPGATPDKTIDCSQWSLKNVERPNHGLAHGLRQGLSSVDIVDELNKHADSFQNADAKLIAKWVQGKIKTDPNFRKKVLFASAFQRTGRISETDDSSSFKPKDAANFYKEAQSYVGHGKLFNSPQDVEIYRDALYSGGKQQVSEDSIYLGRIFYASHWLDLRRLVYAGNTSFQHETVDELFNTGGGSTPELDAFIKILWDRMGKYLTATGDRDGDPGSGRKFPGYYFEKFCKLSNDPAFMVDSLFKAR